MLRSLPGMRFLGPFLLQLSSGIVVVRAFPVTSTSSISCRKQQRLFVLPRTTEPPENNNSCIIRLMSSASSTSSSSVPPQQQQQRSGPCVLGGDFAGLSATFDAATGALIPVPESMVPASLLEWGYPPSSLEVLVSEDDAPAIAIVVTTPVADDDTPADDTQVMGQQWNRQTTTIFPATGCGVDNLDTTKSVEQVHTAMSKNKGGGMWLSSCFDNGNDHQEKDETDDSISSSSIINSWSVISYPYKAGGQLRLRVETCFGLSSLAAGQQQAQKQHMDNNDKINNTDNHDNNNGENERRDRYRSRLQVDLVRVIKDDDDDEERNKWKLINPVRVCLERQIDTASSGGTVADSGGLDGRQVSQWLGPILSRQAMQSFAEQDMTGVAWRPLQQHHGSSSFDDSAEIEGSASSIKDSMILLPGNLTLDFRTSTAENSDSAGGQVQYQILDVGQIYPESGVRQLIRHTFRVVDDDEEDTVANRSADVTSWLEKGLYEDEK